MMERQAALYVRISSDPSGMRLGVTRQLEDCQIKASAMGWHVARVYEDNDVSASTARRRPQYEQMLADIEAGRISAVVVWDLDRLTRRPIEIEHFIDLADRYGVQLASVGGDADLSTDNGRLFARIKGAVARSEVERKSTRQKRANLQRAHSGAPSGGRRPFGYTPDRMALVPDEAEAVRDAAESLLAGDSIRSIAARMNAAGFVTTAGRHWRPTELRRMLAKPRYAGLVVYQDEVLGCGNWPPILDIDTHHAIQSVLSDPRRHASGPPRQHLLSGVARCGTCDGRIFGVMEKNKGALYRCESRRHVTRRADQVDELVQRLMLGTLMKADAADVLVTPRSGEAAATLRAEDAALRNRLKGLAEAFAVGEIDRAQLRAGTDRLRSRLDSINSQLAGMARTPLLTDLMAADDLERFWSNLSTERRRAVIGTLISIRLHPPGRGARVFDQRTVEITWKAA